MRRIAHPVVPAFKPDEPLGRFGRFLDFQGIFKGNGPVGLSVEHQDVPDSGKPGGEIEMQALFLRQGGRPRVGGLFALEARI